MQFLADECCDFTIVRTLRADGHDVLAMAEGRVRTDDRDLLELALRDDRILITEDKDFGWLVFAARLESPGVVLVRYPALSRASLGRDMQGLIRTHGSSIAGNFVVVRPGSFRISPKSMNS